MNKNKNKNNEKDGRYYAIIPLIDEGKIKTFGQIFEYIPKTTVADDMGLVHGTFENILNNPRSMEIGELFILARLLECEPCKLLVLFGPTKSGE